MTMAVPAPSVARSTGGRKFYIPTPTVTASLGADGRMRLHGIASSTLKDRHGDTMTEKALTSMAKQAVGLSLYLNHSYVVPEDLAGTVTGADVRRATDGVLELHYDMDINAANDRAVKTWQAIEGGSKLGLSIGAILVDGSWKRNQDGTFTIDDLDLLETSFVAHPANTRSWVEYAIKGLTGWYPKRLFELEQKHGQGFYLKAAAEANAEVAESEQGEADESEIVGFGNPLPDVTHQETMGDALGLPTVTGPTLGPEAIIGLSGPTPTVLGEAGPEQIAVLKESHPELPDSAFACKDANGRHYPHHHADGSIWLALLRNALARVADAANTQCGKGHLEAHAKAEGIGQNAKALGLTFDVTKAMIAAALGPTEEVDHYLVAELVIPAVHPDLSEGGGAHLHPHAHDHTHEHMHSDWNGDQTQHSHEHAHVHSHEHEDGHEHADTMNDDQHDHYHDGSWDDGHAHGEKAADPDITKGSTTTWHPDGTVVQHTEPDADDEPEKGKSKAATPQANPEKDPEDEDGLDAIESEDGLDNDKLLGDDVTKALESLQPSLAATIDGNVDLIRALVADNGDLRTRNARLEAERDAAVEAAKEVIASAQALTDKVSNMPMGRRAIVREASEGLAHLQSVYGDSILKTLERGSTE